MCVLCPLSSLLSGPPPALLGPVALQFISVYLKDPPVVFVRVLVLVQLLVLLLVFGFDFPPAQDVLLKFKCHALAKCFNQRGDPFELVNTPKIHRYFFGYLRVIDTQHTDTPVDTGLSRTSR